MPRANEGTLLENIVLVEAARTLCELTADGDTIDFVNSFVMPPLSKWNSKPKDNGMTTEALSNIAKCQDAGRGYANSMKASLNFQPDSGPNGALLTALTLKMNKREGRFWLNDLEEQETRYKGERFQLHQVEEVANQILAVPSSNWTIETCPDFFPESLGNLAARLGRWSAPAARLGYLDPDFYSPTDRDPQSPQTDSASVRTFLETLLGGLSIPVISVHFTCNQMTEVFAAQIAGLCEDGKTTGFESCHFTHGRFATVVHFANTPQSFGAEFVQRVNGSWSEWARLALKRKRPYVLHSYIGGERI